MHKYLSDDYHEPTAREVLQAWMEKQGFGPIAEDKEPWLAYLIRGTDNCKAHWSDDTWNRATILHRGGGPDSKAKLRKVAEALDRLGVQYDVELNQWHFPMLVVTISDALRE